MIRLPDETPLVGLHGMVNENGIVSLGLILLDTLDSVCQTPIDNSDMSMYTGLNDFEKSKLVEDQITDEERTRAQALEAILVYDSMLKARQSKQDVMNQIKNMHNWKPINLHNKKPASVDDLEELLNRLAKYDESNMPATRAELKDMFNQLTKHYSGPGSSKYATETLPITVKDLKSVYEHLKVVNGFRGTHFDNRVDT